LVLPRRRRRRRRRRRAPMASPPLAAFENLPTDAHAVSLWGQQLGTQQGRLSIKEGPSPIGAGRQRLPALGLLRQPWANVTLGDAHRQRDLLSDHANSSAAGGRLQNQFAFNDKDYMRVTTDELSRRNASLNMAVYEQLVSDRFVEEELVCELYKQRVQRRSEAQRRAHREACDRNQQYIAAVDTQFMRRQRRRALEAAMVNAADRMSTPRFRDLDEVITPRLRHEDMRRRNPDLFLPSTTGSAVNSAPASSVQAPTQTRGPASPRDLLQTARERLATLGPQSLLNPPQVSHIPIAVAHDFHRSRILNEAGMKMGATRAQPPAPPHEPSSTTPTAASASSTPRRHPHVAGSSGLDAMFSMEWASESRPLTSRF